MILRSCRMLLISLICWLSCNVNVNAQLLKDSATFEKIRKGVDHIYNLEFKEANKIYDEIKSGYPTQTVPFLYKAMIVYWQNYPLVPGTDASRLFEENLVKCYTLAEKYMEEGGTDAEDLLSGLGALGLLLLYYSDNGYTRNVISLAPETYHFVMKSFEFTSSYSDFYFITGLYNYYREAYPELHPIYKPVIIFFPHGDKKLGLKQLKIASDSSIFLQAEANAFLSGIYQGFERDSRKALIYSRKLVEKYPKNTQFNTAYIRDLLLAKKYNEAEKLMDSLPYPYDNKYYQAQIDILRGIIYEKKYKDLVKARKYYWSGIQKAESYKIFGNEYAAYGYFGLSRVYQSGDDKKMKKQYRKQAKELADYEYINFDD